MRTLEINIYLNLELLFEIFYWFLESLLETAEHLSATASLLDSAQLDHIEGRLSALLQNLDNIKEKKENLTDDPEKDKMVLSLKKTAIFNVTKLLFCRLTNYMSW